MGNKIFRGAAVKFSTEGESQYEEIGKFWDFFSEIYGLENLMGLGYNWNSSYIEYAIGLKNGDSPDMELIKREYGNAICKEILLPKEGWQDFSGHRDRLSDLYKEIYDDGSLLFETEEFFENGSCRISVCRNLLSYECVGEQEFESVMKLYRSAIGQEGCAWDENYPTEEILMEDIKEKALYGVRDDKGSLVALVAHDRDVEVEKLKCWSPKTLPAGELARLVVSSGYQNQGLGRMMLRCGMDALSKKGYKGVHYLVAKDNERAVRSYSALNFNRVGETDLFGVHFLCFEKGI